jgi:hypothetical protein
MKLPDTDFETDTEELSPAAAHDRWTSVVNLDEEELREVQDSERNAIYLERAEGNQEEDPPIPGGPLDDAIHLASTPADEWGPDERAEADEAINFLSRWRADFDQSEGEPLLPDEEPRIHKDEMSGIRWGFDPSDDGFP